VDSPQYPGNSRLGPDPGAVFRFIALLALAQHPPRLHHTKGLLSPTSCEPRNWLRDTAERGSRCTAPRRGYLLCCGLLICNTSGFSLRSGNRPGSFVGICYHSRFQPDTDRRFMNPSNTQPVTDHVPPLGRDTHRDTSPYSASPGSRLDRLSLVPGTSLPAVIRRRHLDIAGRTVRLLRRWMSRMGSTAPPHAPYSPGLIPLLASTILQHGLLREAKQGLLQLPGAQDSCRSSPT
jgi:hypothetical protein